MGVRLIAHRGGIVEEAGQENTLSALRRAIDSGYWGVEIDVRETMDHRIVLSHDADLRRCFGLDCRIAESTLDELRRAIPERGGVPLPTLEEAGAVCSERLEVMVEIKEQAPTLAFLARVEEVLSRHALLNQALFIGSEAGKRHFRGKAKVAARLPLFRRSVLGDEEFARRHFLFDHGCDLTPADVGAAQAAGLLVVPTVNLFHYPEGRAHDLAARDTEWLLDAGVTTFQIDSAFRQCFPP